jgi:abhydrolase domain-containing protein 14
LNASIWETLHTIQLLVDAGYRVRAIDLPGTEGTNTPAIPMSMWLATVVNMFSIWPSVIVTPSMSGAYAFAFVSQLSAPTTKTALSPTVAGLVTIAPVKVRDYIQYFPKFTAPALIVTGDNDQHGLETLPILQTMPNHVTHIVSGAGSECYVEKPDEFHAALLQYLHKLPLLYNPN